MVALTARSPRLNRTASGSRMFKVDNYQTKMDALEQSSANASVSMERNLPRFMNPTIGKIRKHEDQYEAEAVTASELVRRDSPSKRAS